MRTTTIAIAVAGIFIAGSAQAQRKATTSVEKTTIWKTTDNKGKPIPSLFWLPSGKHGKEVTKAWALRNGVQITQTKNYDQNDKLTHTRRVVQGNGHRNEILSYKALSPTVWSTSPGSQTDRSQEVTMVSQKKSWHAGNTRFTVSRESSSLRDLAGKKFTERRGTHVTSPVGYKGGGPVIMLPIYEPQPKK